MESGEPFIPAASRHKRAESPPRVVVDKAVRDLIAAGMGVEDTAKRDGKQGALDGVPNLALGAVIGEPGVEDDNGPPGPPKKDITEKSTDKVKDHGEPGKPAGDSVEFGFLRYGLPGAIEEGHLAAAVAAHAARDLAKGPIV